MKIFTAREIREIDQATIKNEPIRSVDLMERAASSIFKWVELNIDRAKGITVFAGPGNNGGDGLALARMMIEARYRVEVCFVDISENRSADLNINMDRLKGLGVDIVFAKKISDLPIISFDTVIIDAIFGTGLNKRIDGFAADVVKYINRSGASVFAIDIPSGLFSENNSDNDSDSIIRATKTLTLQFPKIAFFMADNYSFTGDFVTLPIGLDQKTIREKQTNFFVTGKEVVKSMLKPVGKFDHKGTNGHGLIVSGSCGRAGAAVLSSKAALRTGIGLLTAHVPRRVEGIIHTSVPEAMVQCDQSDILVSEIFDLDRYDAIGIGPGIGTKQNTVKAVEKLISESILPMVIDADALNIIAGNKLLLNNLPENTILTPHPGEFDRLAGKSESGFERLEKQRQMAMDSGSIIVLKGAYTSVAFPDGRTWFNSTGNPGMATAGSGDVLTGMILSLLAQGYSPTDASLAGVFIHGLAGDIAAEKFGYESLIASDIIDNIGESFIRIRKE